MLENAHVYYADKYVSRKEDIPYEPHWAILHITMEHVPGDERSRTDPGHGYPAHEETRISYEVYLTEEKWKYRIEKMEKSTTKWSYVAMRVNPATIKHYHSVTVEE